MSESEREWGGIQIVIIIIKDTIIQIDVVVITVEVIGKKERGQSCMWEGEMRVCWGIWRGDRLVSEQTGWYIQCHKWYIFIQ